MERYVNVEKMIEALKDETCTTCVDNRGDDTTYCETRCDFYAFLNEVENYADQCGINGQEDGKRYIDADKLVKAIPETRVDIFENCRNCTTLLRDEVVDIINAQPVIVGKEVVHGHWIYEKIVADDTHQYRCSECGGHELVMTAYCWKCGAEMLTHTVEAAIRETGVRVAEPAQEREGEQE